METSLIDVDFSENLEDETIEKVIIQQVVSRLPDKERAVVGLRLAGYTQQDCSLIIGGTRASIGIIHKRALEKLRNWLSGVTE